MPTEPQWPPKKHHPTFSPEGISFEICLWSWFTWNCGPLGPGGATVSLCQPYPSVLQMGSLKSRQGQPPALDPPQKSPGWEGVSAGSRAPLQPYKKSPVAM